MVEVKLENDAAFAPDPGEEQSATSAESGLGLVKGVKGEELSEEWLAIVEDALADLHAGRFIPYEEMKKEFGS